MTRLTPGNSSNPPAPSETYAHDLPGSVEPDFDVIVVGAGFGGLYSLHRFRSDGLSVRLIEAAPTVGGAWYWNAYPGARCDVESADYSYTFSPELDQEWNWTERYATQPEIQAYIHHVADRFGLWEDMQFNTRVESARYDETLARWTVETDAGDTLSASHVVFATGGLSAPLAPQFPGTDEFQGESYMTSMWPQEGVDFSGKRVAIIGTGSSGVQVVPTIADATDHVYILQRTPQYCIPCRNHPLSAEDMEDIKATYPERRLRQRRSQTGTSITVNRAPATDFSADEAREQLESRWAEGGALTFSVAFSDVYTNRESNQVVSDFLKEKIRERVSDPKLADLVSPGDLPFAAKRPIADNGYYEALNRDDVDIIDIRTNPISRVTPDGIQLADGTSIDVDIIIYAIGYDAMTGALTRIDITGREGKQLREIWSEAPDTYLGLATSGFPNMFMIGGTGVPFAMFVALVERQVEWVSRCLGDLKSKGIVEIEALEEAQEKWGNQIDTLAEQSIYALAKDSYYYGANVPGKPQKFGIYLGGLGNYRKICDRVADAGYEGFRLRSRQSGKHEKALADSNAAS